MTDTTLEIKCDTAELTALMKDIAGRFEALGDDVPEQARRIAERVEKEPGKYFRLSWENRDGAPVIAVNPSPTLVELRDFLAKV